MGRLQAKKSKYVYLYLYLYLLYYMKQQVEWIMNENLGGWMVWDLASDDFTGKFCRAGKYPLLKRLNKALVGETIGGISMR